MNRSDYKAQRTKRRFKRPKNTNHTHAHKQARKATRRARRHQKQATTHKHAGSKATNPQTLFQALCLPGSPTRERDLRPPLPNNNLPPNYFPSGGFGFLLYCPRLAAASCCVFTLWHGGHNHCRLLSSSVPPRLWLTMWSSSSGSPVPHLAH